MSDSVRPHRQQPTRLPCPWDSLGKNTGVGCHFLLQCMKVESESEVAQSCPTLGIPWTAAHQALPSMEFSRQEYWSGVPLPSLPEIPRGRQKLSLQKIFRGGRRHRPRHSSPRERTLWPAPSPGVWVGVCMGSSPRGQTGPHWAGQRCLLVGALGAF